MLTMPSNDIVIAASRVYLLRDPMQKRVTMLQKLRDLRKLLFRMRMPALVGISCIAAVQLQHIAWLLTFPNPLLQAYLV